MGFPFPIQAGGPHTQAAPSMSAVFTHPHGFPHMPEPFSHTFPRLPQSPYACADPHRFSQFPIRFRGSHIQSPGSKNLTLIPTRPALPAPQTRHPWVSTNSLRRLPARYRMSRRNTNPPRPAAGSLKPTRPTDLLKLPAPTRGAWVWHRLAMRRRRRGVAATSTSTSGGASTCVMIGPKGPIVVEPEGVQLWPASSGLVRLNNGPPKGGLLRVQLYSLFLIYLPTNGHSHQA